MVPEQIEVGEKESNESNSPKDVKRQEHQRENKQTEGKQTHSQRKRVPRIAPLHGILLLAAECDDTLWSSGTWTESLAFKSTFPPAQAPH